uniref:LIM zinc-binding domain-containing protein n=1 Tax=Macrostomum lignano TaxID=282301 RepID=A0A1I8JJZ9_9PLAT
MIKKSLAKCQRCGRAVYQTEKIGPINDAVFHRNCFRCQTCNISLNVGTYCANPADSADRGVYCASHRPQLKNTQMDMEAVGLRTAVSAQNFYNKTKDRDADIHRKSQVDAQAISIKQAVTCTRMRNEDLDAKAITRSQVPTVELESVGIQGPVRAQRMRRQKRATYSRHHFFPQLVAQRRKEMREAQATLERRHREEEDSLFRRLMEERELRERKLAAEMKETWGDPAGRADPAASARRFKEQEQRSLIESQIQEQAQERTAELVARQSREMLQLLAKKQQEMESNSVTNTNDPSMGATSSNHDDDDNADNLQQELEDLEEGGRQGGGGGSGGSPNVQSMASMTLTANYENSSSSIATVDQQQQDQDHQEDDAKTQHPASGDDAATSIDSVELPQPQAAGDEDQSDAVPIIPERVPSPVAPTRRKSALYTDASIFRQLDEHVINIAEGEQLTFTDLADQLTTMCMSELEKVRAIFRWITVKDLSALRIDKWNPDTPMGLLRGIQFGTETYHVLFMRLCSYAGIHAVEIKGYSKSVGYEPGMKFRQANKFKNTWNAVYVEGEWRLIQCNWAARHLVFNRTTGSSQAASAAAAPATSPSTSSGTSGGGASENLRYHYDEHYFLTDPDQFIYEFYPLDPRWQLLEKPISLAEFEELPFVRSAFFQYGMRFPSGTKAVLETDTTGGAILELGLRDPSLPLVCHYQLRNAETGAAHYKGTKLDRFVFFTVRSPGRLVFDVHVPNLDAYFLEIFAALVEPNNPATYGYQVRLKCVAKLKVVAPELQKRMTPLPQSSSSTGEWGPSKAMRHFLIQPMSHTAAGINFDGSLSRELSIDFQVPASILSENSAFSVLLHKNGITPQALSRYARIQMDERRSVLTVRFQPPESGAYALEIFLERKNSQPTHVCKYLVRCLNVQSNAVLTLTKPPVPDEFKVKSGANSPVVKRLAVAYASDVPFKSSVDGKSVSLRFAFSDEQHLEFITSLSRLPSDGKKQNSTDSSAVEDHSDNCEIRVVDQVAKVIAHFVTDGRYNLHLLARRAQSDAQFELCYTFKLDVTLPKAVPSQSA